MAKFPNSLWERRFNSSSLHRQTTDCPPVFQKSSQVLTLSSVLCFKSPAVESHLEWGGYCSNPFVPKRLHTYAYLHTQTHTHTQPCLDLNAAAPLRQLGEGREKATGGEEPVSCLLLLLSPAPSCSHPLPSSALHLNCIPAQIRISLSSSPLLPPVSPPHRSRSWAPQNTAAPQSLAASDAARLSANATSGRILALAWSCGRGRGCEAGRGEGGVGKDTKTASWLRARLHCASGRRGSLVSG